MFKGKFFNILLILISLVFLAGGSCSLFDSGDDDDDVEKEVLELAVDLIPDPIVDLIPDPIEVPEDVPIEIPVVVPPHMSGSGSSGEVGTIGG